MIITEELGDKVDSFVRDEMLVLGRNKLLPRLLGVTSKNTIKVRVQLKIIRIEVVKEFLRTENLCNLYQLVVVVVSVKERFLAEDHSREHATQTPHVQSIIVLLQINEKFGALEIPRRDSNIVLSSGMVKLRQPPINQPQLTLLVIDHHVVRLYVTVHHTIRVAIVKRLQKFKDIIANVKVRKRRVQHLEVSVVDVLKDERGRLALRIANDVQQLDNVGTAAHVLKDLNLALNLLLLDWFEDLDNALGVVDDVHALKDLAVFSAANLPNDFVLFLIAPVNREGFVVPIVTRTVDVNVGVYSVKDGKDIEDTSE